MCPVLEMTLHKPCILHCIIRVRLSRALVGRSSRLLEERAVTATHDWLAQGSVNACDTRVEYGCSAHFVVEVKRLFENRPFQ